MKYSITVNAPNTSSREVLREWSAGVDKALIAHKKTMPRHFDSSAPRRYRGPYLRASKAKMKAAIRRRFERASPQEREAMRRRYARSRDAKGNRPLYETGKLAARVVGGPAVITGPRLARRLELRQLPFYTTQTYEGGIDKVKALQVASPQEVESAAGIVDRQMTTFLNTNTRRL